MPALWFTVIIAKEKNKQKQNNNQTLLMLEGAGAKLVKNKIKHKAQYSCCEVLLGLKDQK